MSQPEEGEEQQIEQPKFNFKLIISIVIGINILLFILLTLPKINKRNELQDKECEILKTEIIQETCKARECIGKSFFSLKIQRKRKKSKM
jgi:hypothetical protein